MMETATMTLSEFLLARIAEDEGAARAILEHFYGEGRWRWDLHSPPPVKVSLVDERGVSMVDARGDGPTWMVTDHIARHDPARVLAECEAKRRIVKYLPAVVEHYAPFEREWEWCPNALTEPLGDLEWGLEAKCTCGATETNAHGGPMILRFLSLPYANHPDYLPEWRP